MVYEIAGLRVLIKNKYNYTAQFCEKYLSADQTSAADIAVEVDEREIAKEKANFPAASDGYVENVCIYRDLCLQTLRFDRILLHAAILEYDGNGYAFLGRSGTGKTTHTGLWLSCVKGARIINGDKPILSYEDGAIYAYGTPWMGKEQQGVNAKTRLKALCFLQQAKENKLMKLSTGEAVGRLFGQILRPSEENLAEKTLELCDKLLQNVPAYLLQCDISEQAVKTAFEGLTGQHYPKNI